MKARTEPWMLLLMILVGAIIGSLLWSLVTPYLPEIFSGRSRWGPRVRR